MSQDPGSDNVNGPLTFGGFATSATPRRPQVAFYPRAAIGNLKDLFGISSRFLEVNAGTGILTGQLIRAGLHVTVCEQRPECRAHLERTLPGVVVVTPNVVAEFAPDDQFDVVICGIHRSESSPLTPTEHLCNLRSLAPTPTVLRPGGAWVVVQQDANELVIEYAKS